MRTCKTILAALIAAAVVNLMVGCGNPSDMLGTVEDRVAEAQAAPEYSVTYDGHGHDGGTVPTDSSKYREGTIVTVKSNISLVLSGYIFIGWNTKENGDGEFYSEGDTFPMPEHDVILYAQWSENTVYTITYHLNGGVNHVDNPDSYTVDSDTITLQAPNKTGYSFEGWFDNDSFIGTPITQIPQGSTGAREFWAQWSIKQYQITYDPKNASSGSAPAPQTGDYQSELIISENTGNLIGPEVEGEHSGSGIKQVFLGWSQNQSATSVDYVGGDPFEITDNTTLYAVYTNDESVLRKIGPGGGWVFYDNGSTQTWGRYLEAWIEDEGNYNWKTENTSTGGTSELIGEGYSNTYGDMTGSEHPGAEEIRNKSHGEKEDWHLPALNELNKMYLNLHCGENDDDDNENYEPIGGFMSGVYWSSSEGNETDAWGTDFNTGISLTVKKNYSSDPTLVRAVRAFP